MDYQNPPANVTGGGPPPATTTVSAAPSASVANAAAGPALPFGAPAVGVAPIGPPYSYFIVSYSYPGAPRIPRHIFTSIPPTNQLPSLPEWFLGPLYPLTVSDNFVPIHPIPPPTPDIRIYLDTKQDTWGGKERDNMNNLAYFPNPSYVPLLVGMYNGEITVDQTTIDRAAQNNGFDNITGSIVIGLNTTIEIVIENLIGTIGISTPHPFHIHGGDFWDMGNGPGGFTDDAFQEHLASITPVKRDTTVIMSDPGNGTLGDPEGIS